MSEYVMYGLLSFIVLGVFLNLLFQYLSSQKDQSIDVNHLSNALNIPSITDIKTALDIPNTESIGMALNASLAQQGIAEKIGAFGHASEELRSVANEFNRNMLKKSERASWGEWALEENLKEVFAGVEVRKVVPEIGKTPDAHLRLDGRVLCIDSKFVLDTYNKYYGTPESQKVNREKLLKTFEKDVIIHVDKIRDDYVQPGKGTHRVAYMFIPSNSVYDFLISNFDTLLRKAASQGVIICSPMTLIANMHMLKMAAIATNTSSMHNEILDAHERIVKEFIELESSWGTLQKHANNLSGKISPVASKVAALGGEIGGLRQLSKSLSSTQTTTDSLDSNEDLDEDLDENLDEDLDEDSDEEPTQTTTDSLDSNEDLDEE
jgi:DNA recombination protein RmuC